jgi:acyl-CoA reductase-like NAD-dependent aldehyde dehydrogenase
VGACNGDNAGGFALDGKDVRPSSKKRSESRPTGRRSCAQARKTWAAVSVWERSALCEAIATEIERRADRLADILCFEQGKPRAEALGEAGAAAAGFRLASEEIRYLGGETIPTQDANKLALTLRQPRGVYAVVTPWNFPINIPVEYLAPAIATGNAVVWSPAPTTAFCAIDHMAALIKAGLPKGLVNLVIGEGPVVGDEIVAHPGVDGIGFTGSSASGLKIATRGAGKALLLELGGNGPVIVFEDADLDLAARATAEGAFFNAGQVCAASERVLVHHSVAAVFADKLAKYAREQRLGEPFDPATTMGPLNNPAVARKTREHIEDALSKGAKLVCGGATRPDLGSELFFEPTVLLDVRPDMRINLEETFGPVAPILAFKDDDEAPRYCSGK